jgi:hypothetical protein
MTISATAPNILVVDDERGVYGPQQREGVCRMSVQAAMVAFRERDSAPYRRIDVVVDGVIAGHIYGHDGTYRYFEGASNDIIWSFSDLDLERLKTRICTTLADAPSDHRPSPCIT